MNHYILNQHHQPVQVRGLEAWAHWMKQNAEKYHFCTMIGDNRISTIYLGSSVEEPPQLFETAVFRIDPFKASDIIQTDSYSRARYIHERTVREIRYTFGRLGWGYRLIDALATWLVNVRTERAKYERSQ